MKSKKELMPSTKEKSYFGLNSGAYPFTNEPLSDICSEKLNFNENSLVITSSGDIQILLAGLGAKNISSVDVSQKANAWADYKWTIFKNYSKEEYNEILIINPTWNNFPIGLPVLNSSKNLFLKEKGKNHEKIYQSKIFKQVKFSELKINSMGYLGKNYDFFQKRLKEVNLNFHVGDLGNHNLIRGLEKKFSFVYLSNVLDHLKGKNNLNYDFSKKNIIQTLKPIIESLDPFGQILYNFAWNERAIPGTIKALKYFNQSLRKIEKKTKGCGKMYISEK